PGLSGSETRGGRAVLMRGVLIRSPWISLRSIRATVLRDKPLQPRQIRGERLEILLRGGVHEVRHAGIIAAEAGAEIHHALKDVIRTLSGETRLGAFALVSGLVAARAPDRCVGPRRPRRDRIRGTGLAQIGPGFLGKIERDRQHIVALK